MKLPYDDRLSKYADFKQMLELYQSGQVPPMYCIEVTLSHDEIPKADREAFMDYVYNNLDFGNPEYVSEMWEEPEDKMDIILIHRLPIELLQAYMQKTAAQA